MTGVQTCALPISDLHNTPHICTPSLHFPLQKVMKYNTSLPFERKTAFFQDFSKLFFFLTRILTANRKKEDGISCVMPRIFADFFDFVLTANWLLIRCESPKSLFFFWIYNDFLDNIYRNTMKNLPIIRLTAHKCWAKMLTNWFLRDNIAETHEKYAIFLR